jgi:hypothetical protein
MSQTETVRIRLLIEAAVALADRPQAEWVTATAVDEWLTSWGTDQERWYPTDLWSSAPLRSRPR